MRCFQSMWTKRTCRRSARHSRTRPGNGATVAWQPGRIAGRASGVEVYKFEPTELRARDSIRRTRNDADLGLVNSQTAEVTAVADVRDPSVLRIGPDDEPTPRRHPAPSAAGYTICATLCINVTRFDLTPDGTCRAKRRRLPLFSNRIPNFGIPVNLPHTRVRPARRGHPLRPCRGAVRVCTLGAAEGPRS